MEALEGGHSAFAARIVFVVAPRRFKRSANSARIVFASRLVIVLVIPNANVIGQTQRRRFYERARLLPFVRFTVSIYIDRRLDQDLT